MWNLLKIKLLTAIDVSQSTPKLPQVKMLPPPPAYNRSTFIIREPFDGTTLPGGEPAGPENSRR